MAAHKAPGIQLSAEQEAALNDLVPAHSTWQKLTDRARIILLAAAAKASARRPRRLASGAVRLGGHKQRAFTLVQVRRAQRKALTDAARTDHPHKNW